MAVWVLGGAGILVVLGALGVALKKKDAKGREKEDDDSGKCDNIKELLEQKKAELEEFARTWPEERLKETGKDAIIKEVRKDEDTARMLDAAEEAKARYDQIKQAVEVLQRKYELCMLSLPEMGPASYRGTVIEDSLSDNDVLQGIEVTERYEIGGWRASDILANEKQMENIGACLKDGPWCMRFWRPGGDEMIIAFRDRKFRVRHSDKATWQEALTYGRARGVPAEQLDFAARD